MSNMSLNAIFLHFTSLSTVEASSNSDNFASFIHRQDCTLLIAYVIE